MKNKLILPALTLFALGLGYPPAQTLAAEERINHYEGKEFASQKQALETLKQKNDEITAIISNVPITMSNLESIHEITYIMEDAIAVLSKDSQHDFTVLSETLENVHLNSENHRADKTKDYFTALQPELEKLYKAYQ